MSSNGASDNAVDPAASPPGRKRGRVEEVTFQSLDSFCSTFQHHNSTGRGRDGAVIEGSQQETLPLLQISSQPLWMPALQEARRRQREQQEQQPPSAPQPPQAPADDRSRAASVAVSSVPTATTTTARTTGNAASSMTTATSSSSLLLNRVAALHRQVQQAKTDERAKALAANFGTKGSSSSSAQGGGGSKAEKQQQQQSAPTGPPNGNVPITGPGASTSTNSIPIPPLPRPAAQQPRAKKRTVVTAQREPPAKPSAVPHQDCAEALLRRQVPDQVDAAVEVTEENQMQPFLESILAAASNPENVVPQLVAVTPLFLDPQATGIASNITSSFTLCAESQKSCPALFTDPYRFAQQCRGLLVVYNGQAGVLSPQLAVVFMKTLLCCPNHIDVTTFDAVYVFTLLLVWEKQGLLLTPATAAIENQQPLAAAAPRGQLWSQRISDIRVPCWMLNPRDPSLDFDAIRAQYLEERQCKNSVFSMSGTVERTSLLPLLHKKLRRNLGMNEMAKPYFDTEQHIPLICASMKVNGFFVDSTRLSQFLGEIDGNIERVAREVHGYTHSVMPSFNIQSVDDVRTMLYDHLKLGAYLPGMPSTATSGGGTTTDNATSNRTKGGKLSTSEETLNILSNHHPLPRLIVQHRKARHEKVESEAITKNLCDVTTTVPDPILSSGGGTTPRPQLMQNLRVVYPNFKQQNVDTGRLSCMEPNLQSLGRVAVDKPGSTGGRKLLVAGEGFTVLAVDYDQIELRVLAHMSQDKALLAALGANGSPAVDIHRRIAANVMRKAEALVTTEERANAKRVVFGTLYGMGVARLAAELNESPEFARSIQRQFRSWFPTVERYQRTVIDECRNSPHAAVRTLMGRLRLLPAIRATDFEGRSAAERQAFNTVIQGSAADVVKRAMLRFFKTQQEAPPQSMLRRSVLRCQIHDELVVTCPTEGWQEVANALKEVMTTAVLLSLPLPVKLSVGPSLGELDPVPHRPNAQEESE